MLSLFLTAFVHHLKSRRGWGWAGVGPELQAEPLIALARSRDPIDREQLLARLVDLCESQHGELGPSSAREAEAVFFALVRDAERDIRARLAERLARADWAPPRLIETLASDDIEVARPIIAASPLLKDETLIRLVTEATLAHRVEVAQRPRISASVVEAVLDQAEPAVLTALAGNGTADISRSCMGRLVEHARTIAALGAPLTAHPRMNAELAQALYLWVGQSLRAAIVERFEVDAAALDAALAASMAEGPPRPRRNGPDVSELKLVDKLAAAGQLKPSYLMRVLKEHQLGLFEAALAKLGGFRIEDVHRASGSRDRPELLALACAAVGLDRSVFPTLLELVRQCNDGLPGGGAEGARRAMSAFGPFAPDIAASAFRQSITAV
jgi:uncharacterized protein (DUF2336 family)